MQSFVNKYAQGVHGHTHEQDADEGMSYMIRGEMNPGNTAEINSGKDDDFLGSLNW